MTKPTILELADDYAKAYFMGRPEDARKRLQAAVMNAETEAHRAVLVEREAGIKLLEDHLKTTNGLMSDDTYRMAVRHCVEALCARGDK